MNIETYKKRFFITNADYVNFRQAGEFLRDEFDNVHGASVEWIYVFTKIFDLLPQQVFDRISKQMSADWPAFCNAEIDDKYIARQVETAQTYISYNVPFEQYYGYTMCFFEHIENALFRKGVNDAILLRSVRKLLRVGEAVIVDSYQQAATLALVEQNQVLMAMSTPIAQLWDGILLLPLVGIVDSKWAQDVMRAMLERIASSQSKVFILDISGIAVVYTAVANYLIKMTKAAKLMGYLCIISGISGAVAQTIVELGINIDEIETCGSMYARCPENCPEYNKKTKYIKRVELCRLLS